MVTIKFDTDNAAFGDDPTEADRGEICECLKRVSDAIYRGKTEGAVMDSNGNKVGTFSVED